MKLRFLLISLLALVNLFCLHSQETASTFTYKFGTMDITLLQELSKTDKPDVLIGLTPEILKECAPEGTFSGAVNAFIVRVNGKNILIDSGFGTKLFDNLQTLGIAAEDIDIVLLTHLHGDHITGMLKDGKISFPNAQVYLSQREHDYWLNETDDKTSHAVLTAYKDRLHLFQPRDFNGKKVEILPGVEAIKAYGHTQGHTAYLFTSLDNQFLIIGDVVNVAAVQFAYPQVAAIYDKDAKEASEMRVKVFKFASENNIPVGGMHIPYPSMGFVVEKQDGKFQFVSLK